LPKRVVTLEIDPSIIRIMETNDGKVIKWANLALDSTIAEDGVFPDPQTLVAAIKQVVTSSGIEAKDVIASVSGLYSINRLLPRASMSGVINQETVMAMTQETVSVPINDLYITWQTIAVSEDEQRIFVVGVPRDIIDTEVRALKAAGIKPRLVEMKPVALARAVDRENALILGIEPSSIDFVVVVESIPVVMRTMPWTQGDLAVEDIVEHLVVNLELTVGFYNSQHPSLPLETDTPLFITGQMSGDLELIEKLKDKVSYPLTLLVSPLEYPAHLPVSQYAVNIGLALKEGVPDGDGMQGSNIPIDINLLPDIYKPWRPTMRQIYLACGVMAFLALLFPMFNLASGAMDETNTMKATHSNLQNKMTEKQLEIQKREPIQKAINEYHTLVELGGDFVGELEVIDDEAKKLGVNVESVLHEGNTIKVICQASDYITFDNYLKTLAESGLFSNPIPPPEGYPYITGGTIELVRQPAK
jgi:type IV pilus assembly protein PilM